MVRRVILFASVFILVFLSSQIIVYAEDSETIPEEYDDLLDSIPDDIADLLPEEIFIRNSDNIASGAKKLISWDYILEYLFNTIGLNLKQIVRVFSIILSLLVLCALLNLLRHSIKNSAIDGIINLVASISIVSTIMEVSKEPILQSISLLDEIQIFVNSVSPTITAMYAMGGNVNTAVVHNYGLIVFLSILENICIISLELISGVCLSLTMASAFVREGNLLALSSGIKKVFSFLWGFITLGFTTVISAQTLLSGKADNLSSKTAKMLVGHIIPLAGGTVGESLKTAGASIEYLRSNVGIVIIVIFIMMTVPTIISIALYRLAFIISNAIAGLLGCEREGRIIMEISSIFGYILAVISVCSIILLYLITIFAKCASPLC